MYQLEHTNIKLRRIPLKGPFKLLWTILLIASLGPLAYGQVDQGRIGGAVKDVSGAVIPGATVTVINERTGEERTALSVDSGTYIIAALRPSTYTVKASLPGFAEAESKGIQLVVGQRMNLDLTL